MVEKTVVIISRMTAYATRGLKIAAKSEVLKRKNIQSK